MSNVPKEVLSKWQFFVIAVIFELGSAIVVGIGTEAERNAWIALILATFIGFILILMYHFLLSLVPEKNLFEIMEVAFGRILAIVLTIAYSVYFFYLACFVLRDFLDMIRAAILPQTPSELVAIVLMLVIAYLLYSGLEVIGRFAEFFWPMMILFIVLIGLALYISGEMDFKNLQPVLGNGFKPIINSIFPQLLGFPVGEVPIIFTILMVYVNQFKKTRRVGIYALSTGSILLLFSVIVQITVLGNQRTSFSFPLLSAATMISIADFFERLDAIVVSIMLIGIILKISVFCFIGLKGLEYVFRIQYRPFVFPMSMLVALFSIVHATSLSEHFEKGFRILPAYFHMPFQIYIPIVVLLFILIRQKEKFKK